MAEPDVTNGDEVDDTYDPSTVEANRNIQQGGGVGARDLARQDEPEEIVTPTATATTTTPPSRRWEPLIRRNDRMAEDRAATASTSAIRSRI
jgi:hypothetical protein